MTRSVAPGVEPARPGEILKLPSIGIGTVPLGNLYRSVSDADASATLNAVWDSGIRYFDTAPVYGYGLAEQRLGRSLCDRPRDQYLISTKVGRVLVNGAPEDPALVPDGQPLFVETPTVRPVFDFSRSGTLRSLEDSLRRLQLDRVDVVYIHDPEDHYAEALGGAYPALHQLRSEGVVHAIGVGTTKNEPLVSFAHEADFDVFLIAGRYSLLDCSAGRELLPECHALGIEVVVGGVFNSGILAAPDATPTFDYLPAEASLRARVRRISAVCDRYDVPIGAAAIQFPLRHPAVSSVLLGMRSPAEVSANVAMSNRPIPDQLWDELIDEGLVDEQLT